ncbi:mechanosensitive ion channel family protein [Siminovitchia fortis]|uniref:mechanosensitive ion channel family protein n=1 Tax=Siminovitchia fortis TaxID=254758 RepID=UPI00119F2C18|nr:mechanosensitive ion channel domain-containing protein [Siminovitchia fortis]
MGDNQMIHGLDFLKNLSLKGILLFFVYVFIIFAVKWTVLFIFKKVYTSGKSKGSFIPTVEAILNWLTFYGTILLFIFYFSREKWLFAPIYKVKGIDVSLFLILVAFMIITFANRIVKVFNTHVMPLAYKRFHVDAGTGYTINRLIYYIVMMIAIMISFAIVGFNWKAIAVIFSTLGIGVGFGLRNVAANFISGLIILFEKPLEVGEVIEVDGKTGVVTKIKLRSTSIKLYKEGTLIIPNQYLIENLIRNLGGEKLYTNITVGVAYGTDTKKAEALLQEAANRGIEGEEGVFPDPPPSVRLTDIQESTLTFSVAIPVKNTESKEKLEDKLRHLIVSSFYKNDIRPADVPDEPEEGNKGD